MLGKTGIMTEQRQVLGFRVDIAPKKILLQQAEHQVSIGQVLQVVTLNPEMITRANREPDLRQAIQGADLCLPDGAGVVWALRRQHFNLDRIPGIEFASDLLATAERQNWRVALIGAKPSIIDQTIIALKLRHPGLHLAFTHHGYFEDAAPVLENCALAMPHLVLLALGVPRQEVLISQWRERFAKNPNGCLLVGVGGSFDVWAGAIARAPEAWQRLNLEWLYRLICQPERWQRLATTLPQFVFRTLTER